MAQGQPRRVRKKAETVSLSAEFFYTYTPRMPMRNPSERHGLSESIDADPQAFINSWRPLANGKSGILSGLGEDGFTIAARFALRRGDQCREADCPFRQFIDDLFGYTEVIRDQLSRISSKPARDIDFLVDRRIKQN